MMEPVPVEAAGPALVGRREEIDRLGEIVAAVRGGASRVVLLAGDAGVGKTRLLGELAHVARAQRFQVAIGACVDHGEEIWPLAPVREIIAQLFDGLDAASFDAAIGAARPVLAHLVPELLGASTDANPITSDRLCELVVGVVRRLTRRGPFLLGFEDLHWADASTRALFGVLAETTRLGPLLLAGTYRTDDLHRRHPMRPLLAELLRRDGISRLDLTPLGPEATAELVHAALGEHADAATVAEFHRRSEGNPFLLEELVTARAAGDAGLPARLRDVLLARAAGLDEGEFEVLAAASAAGRVSLDVLCLVCNIGASEMSARLDRLKRAALLISSDEEVRFRHELAREVFHDELGAGERASVHARLAEALTVSGSSRLGEIAHHWAAAHDQPRAFATSVAAGRQALQAGAASEALGHLERALDLWDRVTDAEHQAGCDHAELLLVAALAAQYADQFDTAIELARRAAGELAGRDPWREGVAHLRLRELFRFTLRWDECAAAVEHALAVIPQSPPSAVLAEALADAAFEHCYASRPAEAVDAGRRAVEAAEAVGDREVLIYARTAERGARSLVDEDPDVALAHARETFALCGSGVRAEVQLVAYNNLIHCLGRLARYEEWSEVAQAGLDLAITSGLGGPRTAWMAQYVVGTLQLLGRWAEAEQCVAEHLDLLQVPGDLGELSTNFAPALLRQGRLAEARLIVEQARPLISDPRSWMEDMAWLASGVVQFDAADGHVEAAIDLVDQILDNVHELCDDGIAELVAHGIRALADRSALAPEGPTHADDTARADRWLAEIERRYAQQQRGVDKLTYRDLAVAERDRLARSAVPERWIEVATSWASLKMPYHEAYARWRAAEAALMGAGTHAAAVRTLATEQLTRAHRLAAALPAPPLVADICALARRARLTLADQAPTNADPQPAAKAFGLTVRELEVLSLVAAGHSNGDIGERLFISTKTASVHVSNILRKLAVTNRVQAAAAYDHHIAPRPPVNA